MTIPFSNPRLVSFCDRQAPYRGHWVIYAAAGPGGYAACHELSDRGEPLRVVEQRLLTSAIEARRFSIHLMLHGWTPEQVNGDQGYTLLGS